MYVSSEQENEERKEVNKIINNKTLFMKGKYITTQIRIAAMAGVKRK